MNDQMIRVISSPSSSTTGFWTLILDSAGTGKRCYLPDVLPVPWLSGQSRARIGTDGNRRTPELRYPRGGKPAAAAGRLQRLLRRPGPGRGRQARGRGLG